MIRATVSRPVYLAMKHPSGAYDQITTVRKLRILGTLWREDDPFTIAAGPRQRSHSPVRVPWGSPPYFTTSDLRLHFSSTPTPSRATLEVFDHASTQVFFIQVEYDG
jgi:hypothetical protein